jgi:hypothetical protein
MGGMIFFILVNGRESDVLNSVVDLEPDLFGSGTLLSGQIRNNCTGSGSDLFDKKVFAHFSPNWSN